jgi:NAD(P)-dependent dehydrogenase (short-subunit alcohol dehydrogenase family)
MKIIVVGATGTIGAAVVRALQAQHEVIGVHRASDPKVDIEDQASLHALFERIGDVDAVVSCSGSAAWKPLLDLDDADFAFSLRNKLMGQVNLTRIALRRLRDAGSVTLTSGILAQKPMNGSGAVSLVNGGLEGFVRAAALEAPRGIRVNVVSPPWVSETLEKMGMKDVAGLPASTVARAYVASIEGRYQGATLEPAQFA